MLIRYASDAAALTPAAASSYAAAAAIVFRHRLFCCHPSRLMPPFHAPRPSGHDAHILPSRLRPFSSPSQDFVGAMAKTRHPGDTARGLLPLPANTPTSPNVYQRRFAMSNITVVILEQASYRI